MTLTARRIDRALKCQSCRRKVNLVVLRGPGSHGDNTDASCPSCGHEVLIDERQLESIERWWENDA